MTNEQIITDIAMTIYGEDAVMKMLEDGIEIPLHTLQGWAARGPYKIKKGEHGIETRLWKKRKHKKNDEEASPNEEASEIPNNRDFYLCKAFLFRIDQIERVPSE